MESSKKNDAKEELLEQEPVPVLVCAGCLAEKKDFCSHLDEEMEEPAHGEEDHLIGKLIGDKYLVRSFIGKGGWGRVYEVEQVVLRKRMALKMLHAKFAVEREKVMRFRKEAQAIAAIEHPNVARMYDFTVGPDGQAFLIMELLTGSTLEEYLEKGNVLDPAEAIELVRQACEGLAAAHAKGIIHRDIKPANVWIERESNGSIKTKILDFGLAKMNDSEAEAVNLTATGDALGTPAYMSPEQCHGQPLDQRTDIYSIACVLYEAISSQKAFSGNSALETMVKHTQGTFIPLKKVMPTLKQAEQLDQILMHALCPDPNERYASVLDFAEDLNKIKQGVALSKRRLTAKEKLLLRRNVILAVSVLLFFCLYFSVQQFVFEKKSNKVVAELPVAPEPSVASMRAAPHALGSGKIESYKGKSLKQYNAEIDKDPNNPKLLYSRGCLYKLREERPNAIADFNRVIELKPGLIEAYVERGSLFGRMSRFKEALADADKAVSLDPKWDWTYMRRAQIELDAEMYDEAIRDCRKAIELAPNRAVAYTEMARAYECMGNRDKAIELVSKAMPLRGASFAEYAARGRFEYKKGNYEQAVKDLKVAAGGDWAEPYAYMAVIYAALGRMKEAEFCSQKAFASDPFPARAYRMRAEALCNAGNFEKAIEDYTQAISMDPENAPAYRFRALVYKKMGQLNNCIADLRKAVELNPRSSTSWSYLARAECELGKPDEALKAIALAFDKLSPTSVSYVNRAAIYARLSRKAEAIADCRAALAIDPYSVEAAGLLKSLMNK